MTSEQIRKRFNDHAPKRLKHFLFYDMRNGGSGVYDPFAPVLFNQLWTNQNEYESALVSFLCEKHHIELYPTAIANDYSNLFIKIYNDYGDRIVFDEFFEYIVDGWTNTAEEYESIHEHMINNIIKCIIENRYKWGNLMKSCLLDFNPLWNVDGVTGEIRETTHTGKDTNSHKGKDTNSKKGYDTNVKSGNEQLDYNGAKTNTKGGKDTTTTSNTTTESTVFYDATKNDTDYGQTDTETFDNRNDKRTYNNVQDKTDYNSSNENEYNSSLERLLDLKDKDLFMQIRQGNIGVTTTTKLLSEFRDYVNYNLLNIIAKDVVSDITKGVY
jgi:hypothetical protein